MARKKYTVVGFYPDNNQPYVGFETAIDPMAAARKTFGKVDADLTIVEVFDGHQMGRLENDEVITDGD